MDFIENILEIYKRKRVLKKITKGLGKITETETTIYCHVNEQKFKNKCDDGDEYAFRLNHKWIYMYGNVYQLRKNIVYVFDGISFYKPIIFAISSPEGTHNSIKFNNCTFTKRITIFEAENVEFKNNKSSSRITFFKTRGVNNLRFVNDNTLSSAAFSDQTYIDISCDTLEMYNTDFDSDSPKICVKNLIMENSNICGYEETKITADQMLLENSEINILDELKLNTNECNDFSGIKADNIIYNGLSLQEHNNSYEEIDRLIETRQSLVDTLATIKLNEENYQKQEVSMYRNELKKSPLTRRLKK